MVKNELILEKGGKFITRFGSTLEVKRPSVVYLRTKSKITPLTEKNILGMKLHKCNGG